MSRHQVLKDGGRRLLVEFAVDNVQKMRVHLNRVNLGAGIAPADSKRGKGGGKGGSRKGDGGRGEEEEDGDASVGDQEANAAGGGAEKRPSRGARQRARKNNAEQPNGADEPTAMASARSSASVPLVAANHQRVLSAAAAAAPNKRKQRKRDAAAALEASVAMPAGSWSAPKAQAAAGSSGGGGSGQGARAERESRRREGDGKQGGKRGRAELLLSENDGMDSMGEGRRSKQRKRESAARSEEHFESLVKQYKQQLGAGASGGLKPALKQQLAEWM